MMLSRVLGAIGRFCITLGVLTLLFVAYQLWGTGILTAQAQDGLENDFESLMEEADGLDAVLIEQAAEAEPTPDPVADTTPEEPAADEETPEERAAREEEERLAAEELELLANLLWQPKGEALAKLRIPDIGVDWTIVAGVGTDELAKGPGHYPGTPLPGMPGNTGIAGHRTTWGAPFNRIDELEPGDEIFVETLQGDFTYRVVEQETGKGHFIVSPDRVDVLDQNFETHPNRITLTACHPKFSARQRIIVVGELVGEPARFIPPPELLDTMGQPGLASEDVEATEVDTGDDQGLPSDPDLSNGEQDASAGAPATDPTPDVSITPESGTGADTGDGAEEEADEGDGADEVVVPVSAPPTDPTSLQGFSSTDDFGEGLNGDRSAIMPAVMWGLAAAAIAGAASFVGRRWKKLPSYAFGVVPFALVLFVCFVHIDQALPSY